jgi:peroxiredoxin
VSPVAEGDESPAALDGQPNPIGRWVVGGTVGTGVTLLLLVGVLALLAGRDTPAPATGGVSALGGASGGNATTVRVGSPAPGFTLVDIDGQVVQLSDFRGRPVWINFWASWCQFCRAEMPVMEERYQREQASGLVMLGIDLQEDPATIRAWVGERFHWRFLMDTKGAAANLYQLAGLPTHVFIDRAGVVHSLRIAQLSGAQMDAELAPILAPDHYHLGAP